MEKLLNIAKLIWKVAEKEGVELPEDLPKISIDKAKSYPVELKTSFHRDFERKGKPTEKETFVNSLLNLADKHNLDSSCIKEIVTENNR